MQIKYKCKYNKKMKNKKLKMKQKIYFFYNLNVMQNIIMNF